MPIVKTSKKSVEVQFGVGDILIGSGMMGDYKQGLVSLVQHEPQPIGKHIKHANPNVDLLDIPISLIFQNTESLDVLIERLEKTKKYMTGEIDIKSEIK